MEELEAAISHLPNGMAAGISGILPEMVKFGGLKLRQELLRLFQLVWRDGQVPADWRNAEIVPVPKKGDLSMCDNWRGIALLDVIGKVAGRLLQCRLQQVSEDVLPESQGGFRRGRSCTDQIFCVRQIVEKLYEHRSKAFLIFVDLRKAYDSVPRRGLWCGLRKLGIPSKLVDLIADFHSGMQASVRVGDSRTDPITVRNGLRQGCSLAPVLFNLYFSLVIARWRCVLQDCPEFQAVTLQYKRSGKLFEKSRRGWESRDWLDLEFADDAVLFAPSRSTALFALESFFSVAADFGLTVSAAKTKVMVGGVGITDDDRLPFLVCGSSVECADAFVYLGSLVTPDTRVSQEVDRRLASASRAFGALRCVFDDNSLSLRCKRLIYTACVLSVLLYGSECWTVLKRDAEKLDRFHHCCLRHILGVSRFDQQHYRVTNSLLRDWWEVSMPLSGLLRQRRLEWLGHVGRMDESRLPSQALFGRLPNPRPWEGPRLRWRDVVHRDLSLLGVTDWFQLCASRNDWRALYLAPPPVCLPSVSAVCCLHCHREFRRHSDYTRHKCSDIRKLPVCQQPGAVQCSQCQRWLRSRGGLAVHKCSAAAIQPNSAPVRFSLTNLGCCPQHCPHCNRCFRSASGFRRHNCSRGSRCRARDDFEYACRNCSRRFRRPQDLSRHVRFCAS